jgi:hypothetical protein
MKRYVLVLAPALAGALFGASAVAVLVKPADAESAPSAPKVASEEAADVHTRSNDNPDAEPFSGLEMTAPPPASRR